MNIGRPLTVRKPGLARTALLSLLFVLGCGTADPVEDPPLAAIVEDIRWEATEYAAARTGDGIRITGSSPVDIEITLELIADTVGTYPVGTGLSSAVVVDEGVSYVAEGTRSGSVTLTGVSDGRVTGYFGFTGKRTPGGGVLRDVTNGEFSLELSSE